MVRGSAIVVGVLQLGVALWNLKSGVWDGATILGSLWLFLPAMGSLRRFAMVGFLMMIEVCPWFYGPDWYHWLPTRCIAVTMTLAMLLRTMGFARAAPQEQRGAQLTTLLTGPVLCLGALVIYWNPARIFDPGYQIPLGSFLASLLLCAPVRFQLWGTLLSAQRWFLTVRVSAHH